MRVLFFALLFCGLSGDLRAQQCLFFRELDSCGISMAKIDSLYPGSMSDDTLNKIFPGGRQAEFRAAWGSYFEDLFQYLANNRFRWEKTTYCFNKIYFSADGQVEYWLFNFKKADVVPADKQERFRSLILAYSREHPIKIKAEGPFSQCASVDFADVKPKRRSPK